MDVDVDTNIIILLLEGRSPAVRSQFDAARAAKKRLSLSVIVHHELLFGAACSAKPAANEVRMQSFISTIGFTIIDFTPADAAEAADIRAHLRRLGTPTGPYDSLIAAQARRRGVPLVTANVREFQRVPGLTVVDWTV